MLNKLSLLAKIMFMVAFCLSFGDANATSDTGRRMDGQLKDVDKSMSKVTRLELCSTEPGKKLCLDNTKQIDQNVTDMQMNTILNTMPGVGGCVLTYNNMTHMMECI